jgi:hypothetical protein
MQDRDIGYPEKTPDVALSLRCWAPFIIMSGAQAVLYTPMPSAFQFRHFSALLQAQPFSVFVFSA